MNKWSFEFVKSVGRMAAGDVFPLISFDLFVFSLTWIPFISPREHVSSICCTALSCMHYITKRTIQAHAGQGEMWISLTTNLKQPYRDENHKHKSLWAKHEEHNLFQEDFKGLLQGLQHWYFIWQFWTEKDSVVIFGLVFWWFSFDYDLPTLLLKTKHSPHDSNNGMTPAQSCSFSCLV